MPTVVQITLIICITIISLYIPTCIIGYKQNKLKNKEEN